MKCADLRMKKLMIERDIPVILSDRELLAAVGRYVELSAGVRVAFLGHYKEVEQDMEFIIGLANSNGADFKYFTDPQEAESWLIGSDQ